MPLAGPDLNTPQWGLRPLHRLPDGQTILKASLASRAWNDALTAADYTFVVREVDGLSSLRDYLQSEWPGCGIVALSHLTQGALLSALAGVAFLKPNDSPLCVDLADIIFDGPDDFWSRWNSNVGGVTPCFMSSDPAFSYLSVDTGRVVAAVEKRVVSRHASAGVYMFRDAAVFLEAAAHSLRNRETQSYGGALYVCPSMNGVLAQGLDVEAPLVLDAKPVGKLFHA